MTILAEPKPPVAKKTNTVSLHRLVKHFVELELGSAKSPPPLPPILAAVAGQPPANPPQPPAPAAPAAPTVSHTLGIASLAAINTPLIALTSVCFKEVPTPWGLILAGIMLVFTCMVNIVLVLRHLRNGRGSSPLWWLLCIPLMLGLILYLRPDIIARVFPWLRVSFIERQAAKLQVEGYLQSIDTLLEMSPSAQPDDELITLVQGALGALTSDRAAANLSAYGISNTDSDSSLTWNDLKDSKAQAEFVRRFREGYGSATDLEIVGMEIQPTPESSPEYLHGVRYWVFATIVYRGRYLMEPQAFNSWSVEALIRGLTVDDSAEHKAIESFLASSFPTMKSEDIHKVCKHVLQGPLANLRNDDKWEKAVAAITANVVPIESEKRYAREQIMVKYPMRHVKGGWKDNPWRIGTSTDRLVTRTEAN